MFDTAVLEGDPKGMVDAELTQHLEHLCAIADHIHAALLAAAGEWDARALWAYDGAPSAASWLAARGRLSRYDAASLAAAGAQLRTMPATSEALEARLLTPAKARLLTKVKNERTEATFAQHEPTLVAEAAKLTVDQTARMLRYWALTADPDGPPPGPEKNAAHMSPTLNGRWRLDADLDNESGATLHTVLTQIADELHHANRQNGTTMPAGRLRADALTELARRASAAGDRPAARPLIWVVADLADLTDETGTGHLHNTDTPITTQTARRLACDADIARILTDGPSTIVDVGRATRTATPTQRRLLAIRDKHCVFPGCDRPPGWCQAHHIIHWINDGPTDLDNLTLLCHHHHHLAHEGRYGLTRTPDGTNHFTRPDGTPLHDPPITP